MKEHTQMEKESKWREGCREREIENTILLLWSYAYAFVVIDWAWNEWMNEENESLYYC